MAMTITPFPPRELAKLVLGYLAEEQLMTAYDEFLQDSPYLDALENEHDRVFMTPLRNIVAEYRALKIYVETCKPFTLRRRLMGCANLLEAVKLLVHLVDINKIGRQEHGASASRLSYDNVNSKTYSRVTNVCDVCSSLHRTRCACHILSQSNASVEATLLEDLPGHHGRKKHVKVLDKEKTLSVSSNEQFQLSSKNPDESSLGSLDQDVVLVDSQKLRQENDCNSDSQSLSHNSHSVREVSNANQKRDVIHTSLSSVSHSPQYKSCPSAGAGRTPRTPRPPRPPARARSPQRGGSLLDFAAGVEGKNTVPDSSTSESNQNSVIPVVNDDIANKEAGDQDGAGVSNKGVTKAHILLKVENNKSSSASCQTSGEPPGVGTTDVTQTHSSRHKPSEQKITILSDIKGADAGEAGEGAGGCGGERAPAVLRHAHAHPAASAPRAVHTVLINGTRAFTRQCSAPHAQGFTREEIMAMPTIILVPAAAAAAATSVAAGQPHKSNTVYVQPPTTETAGASNTVSSTARALGPLLIDVASSASAQNQLQAAESIAQPVKQNEKSKNKVPELQNEGDSATAKTGEFKNATVPKDAEASTKSTPVTVPLPRKSSSTPRRSSHVRVLDFTTPRRILSETIPEHPPSAPDDAATQHHPQVEVILSRSPSLHTFANPSETSESGESDEHAVHKLDSVNKNDECAIATQSIQKIITVKKSDWDADLRALAVANAKMDTPKPKSKSTKRKKGSETNSDVVKSQEKKKSRRKSVAKSTTKIKFKSLEVIEDSIEIVEASPPALAVKPTINVITEHDWGIIPEPEDPDKTKPNNEDETETPEMERLALQNAIGAKLNISDLLETPYKQVLYDIQMETPRFLGPDLPGDPMSDIKIMSIPTPRFLATPKPPQATPSSYSSRPTDYSSSSSYYKPDDHDCIDIGYPAPPPKEIPPESNDVCKNKSKDKSFKSTRPVRKCTKNVSYVNSPNIKAKGDDKDDASVNSESGDSESTQSIKDLESKTSKAETSTKDLKSKTPKAETTTKDLKSKKTPKAETSTKVLKCKTPKAETKRKSSGIKKRKTPVKKETPKSFMKIKPRRPTPVKDSSKKRKQSGTPGRKRTASKDKVDSDSVTTALSLASAPTKSRRKSSTPRKLHCTKQFHSESSGHESPEIVETKNVPTPASSGSGEAEAPPLHWSDEGTQESALTDNHTKFTEDDKNTTSAKPRLGSVTDTEDITKIQEYLAKSEPDKSIKVPDDMEGNMHIDLVKRGFDIETAKIIERDLLDTPPHPKDNLTNGREEPVAVETSKDNKVETSIGEKGDSVSSTSVDVDVEGIDDDEDDIELSVHECNEDSKNFIACNHDDIKDIPRRAPEKLKEKFSMEVCIDDDVAIRLRATPLTFLIDEDPKDEDRLEYNRETEMAVSSISGMAKLYTPLKDQRAQCYEIFDSTLTSLDTPMKVDTPKRRDPEMTVTEIVLEVEKLEVKGKVETKRKRALSGSASDESTNENKKPKPDAQYLLNPANIKNIDIETVLCKLHGP